MADLKYLHYRRQFVIGSKAFTPTCQWQSHSLADNVILSVHPDLETTVSRSEDRLLVLLGFFVDPLHPEAGSSEILSKIAERSERLTDVVDATEALTGRWAMIFKNRDQFAMFHDPCGLRQIYYTCRPDGVWCGSQPEIIRANVPIGPSSDPGIQEFMNSPQYLDSELTWFGNLTPYEGCFHLLPNHSLDLQTGRAQRFFPVKQLPRVEIDQAVDSITALLKGSFDALCRRGSLMLALTAGRDSRTLLAAARDQLPSITCYMDKKGVLPHNHPDVQVPLRLSRKLGFPFTVQNSRQSPPHEFLQILDRNVTCARRLPKTRSIYAKFRRQEVRLNVNGNGGEVGRNFLDPNGTFLNEPLTGDQIAAICKFPDSRFIKEQLTAWVSDLASHDSSMPVLDMCYWEQRMGNWGAHYPAEQDIAVEEISPFNNRRIITTMLSVPDEYRRPPDYVLHTELIRRLWPETLAEPFNPPAPYSFRRDGVAAIRSFVRRSLPDPVVGIVKRAIRRAPNR